MTLTKLDPVIRHLSTLLAQDSAIAVEVLDENSVLLNTAFPQHFSAIETAILAFDYDLAIAALKHAGVYAPDLTAAATGPRQAKKTATILIVDDTPGNLILMSGVLKSDWNVKVVNSGTKALKIAFSDTPPDLIVLDIMMPVMDGYEVCWQLKKNPKTTNIPVIFFTGKSESAFEEKALELGAADYITKPINVDIARHRIRNLMEREGLRKEVESFRDHLSHLVKERSSQLIDRMEQLTAIFELSPDGFVSFDADYRVKYASPAFFRMTGLKEADITALDETAFANLLASGCVPGTRFPGFDALRVSQPCKIHPNNTKAKPCACHSQRQLIEWAGPARRMLEVGFRASESGSISQILYFRDVTHETEVDLMKSEFLTTAAHELRTPMASIYGYAEVLMTQELDEVSRQDYLAIIFKQTELMMSITNELVDLNHLETRHGKDFHFETLSLSQVLDNALSSYEQPEQRDCPVTQASNGQLQVCVDVEKLLQAVVNVMSNAYKYSTPGSAVNIRFRTTLDLNSPMVGIEVQDRGIGMTAQQTTHCFDRFYRADTSGKLAGAGLGLSLAKEIIDLHHGRIEIESEFGKGTAVTLWLPQVLAKPANTAPAKAQEPDEPPALLVWEPTSLGKMIGSNPALQGRKMNMFMDDAAKQVPAIELAVTSGALSVAADLAHTLKTSARMVGAQQMGQLCEEIESAGDNQDAAQCGALVSQLASSFSTVKEQILAHITHRSPA